MVVMKKSTKMLSSSTNVNISSQVIVYLHAYRFVLGRDGVSCEDIDECNTGNGGCDQVNVLIRTLHKRERVQS